eukprot:GHVN01080986.1.p1 GENE.GHVN01080986.1~~GHVN01080986.1.p1  ORF type:complete len:876 (-),score=240.63 GHVN01080986.1:152-2779(-)
MGIQTLPVVVTCDWLTRCLTSRSLVSVGCGGQVSDSRSHSQCVKDEEIENNSQRSTPPQLSHPQSAGSYKARINPMRVERSLLSDLLDGETEERETGQIGDEKKADKGVPRLSEIEGCADDRSEQRLTLLDQANIIREKEMTEVSRERDQVSEVSIETDQVSEVSNEKGEVSEVIRERDESKISEVSEVHTVSGINPLTDTLLMMLDGEAEITAAREVVNEVNKTNNTHTDTGTSCELTGTTAAVGAIFKRKWDEVEGRASSSQRGREADGYGAEHVGGDDDGEVGQCGVVLERVGGDEKRHRSEQDSDSGSGAKAVSEVIEVISDSDRAEGEHENHETEKKVLSEVTELMEEEGDKRGVEKTNAELPNPRLLGGRPLTRQQKRILSIRHKFACQSSPLASPPPTLTSHPLPVSQSQTARSPPGERQITQPAIESSQPTSLNGGKEEAGGGGGISEASEPPSSAPSSSAAGMETPTVLNAALAEHFNRLHELYKGQRGEHWREMAYKKASNIIKSLPFAIETETDLNRWECRGLGAKTRDKAKEFLLTGKIARLKALESDERINTVNLFTSVWGVGVMNAEKFWAIGLRSLDDLRNNLHLLNENQKVGLKHFEEFNQRIPRDEVTEIGNRVMRAVNSLFAPNEIEAQICGSYRRGKSSCGDVDILLARRDNTPPGCEVERILLSLEESGFLTDHLGGSAIFDLNKRSAVIERHRRNVSIAGCHSYMGVCQLTPTSLHRRLDVKIYPREAYPFAILYFTGSDHFNRSMRLYARRLGYSLSDKEIIPVHRVRMGEKHQTGAAIACHSERDIFDVLGLNYREPWQREVDSSWLSQTGATRKDLEMEDVDGNNNSPRSDHTKGLPGDGIKFKHSSPTNR